jgi:hypothetical protein
MSLRSLTRNDVFVSFTWKDGDGEEKSIFCIRHTSTYLASCIFLYSHELRIHGLATLPGSPLKDLYLSLLLRLIWDRRGKNTMNEHYKEARSTVRMSKSMDPRTPKEIQPQPLG